MPSVRLIKHEAVPKCGSYEIRFPHGRPSRFFYWDDIALEATKTLARAEREKGDS
jgi:hypothetical protein